MTRYLLLITSDTTVAASDADREHAPDVEAWVSGLQDRGAYVLGDPLVPADQAVTVRVRAGKVERSDGPFAEAGEVVVGLDVVECAGLDEAVQIAAGHPMAWAHAIEVRAFTTLA